MKQISIDKEKCQKDGICASLCPTHYILGGIKDFPSAKSGGFCMQCGHCMAFCPHDAITVEGLSRQNMKRVQKKLLPAAEAVDLLMMARRSIRQFKNEAVPSDALNHLLATASYAPTAKNIRQLRFILLETPQSMKGLGDCIANSLNEDAADNPKPTIPEGKALANAWRKGADPIMRGAPHLVLAVAPKQWAWAREDAAICLTYLELAAYAHGMGTCWAGYVTTAARTFSSVQSFLGIHETEFVCGGQLLGIPRLHPRFTAPRSPYPVNTL